jgi:hypothetical protein
MGRQGDFAHREKKKGKKNPSKITPITIISTPLEVEVIGKHKKKREEEVEE